jgi:20S proteasome alpha/beta subunit
MLDEHIALAFAGLTADARSVSAALFVARP